MAALHLVYFEEHSVFEIVNVIKDVVYYPSLNIMLVFTHENQILIFDVNSGSVLKRIEIECMNDVSCCYLPSLKRLVSIYRDVLSTRKEHNGVLMLEDLFQQQVQSPTDFVTAVLSLKDAIHLLEASLCSPLGEKKDIAGLLNDLLQEVLRAMKATKSNSKEAKWTTVCMHRPYEVLLKSLVYILKDIKQFKRGLAGLSVISSLVDQVSFLSSACELLHPLDSSGDVDKDLMHNECARRSTFKDCPHLNNTWALPTAQSGFYLQKSSVNDGDDRVICFFCNACIKNWKVKDESWSENKWHSSVCPFVKGDYTQNVPVSATHSTEPAKLHSDGMKVTCIGLTTSDRYFATVMSHSHIVIWDTNTFLKEHADFHVNPSDPALLESLQSKLASYCISPKIEEDRQMTVTSEKLSSCKANIGSLCVIKHPLTAKSKTPGHFLIVGTTMEYSFVHNDPNGLHFLCILIYKMTLQTVKLVQCILLPEKISSSMNIRYIIPSHDGSRLFVVVGTGSEGSVKNKSDATKSETLSWMMIYDLKSGSLVDERSVIDDGPLEDERLLTDENPLAIIPYQHAITCACVLPAWACQTIAEEPQRQQVRENDSLKMFGSALIVTSESETVLLSLTDLTIMGRLRASDQNNPFISATYCSGIDKVCLVTHFNQLKFFSFKSAREHVPSLAGSSVAGAPEQKPKSKVKLVADAVISYHSFKVNASSSMPFLMCHPDCELDVKLANWNSKTSTTCGVMLTNEHKQILFVLQTASREWSLPNGYSFKNEQPITTARRKAKEMLGIVLRKEELKDLRSVILDFLTKNVFFERRCHKEDIEFRIAGIPNQEIQDWR